MSKHLEEGYFETCQRKEKNSLGGNIGVRLIQCAHLTWPQCQIFSQKLF